VIRIIGKMEGVISSGRERREETGLWDEMGAYIGGGGGESYIG
jgi:hypothetical protein